MTRMSPPARQVLVNTIILVGLALEYWRGAPALAILITAVIALPLVNVLMTMKRRQNKARSSNTEV